MQTVRSNRDISTNIRIFIFDLKYPYLSGTIIGRSKEDKNGSVLQREERSINICAMAVMAETAKGSSKIGQGTNGQSYTMLVTSRSKLISRLNFLFKSEVP